jgi:uncharacterized heparinase superfamily protein
MSDDSSAERALVSKLARGSFLSRLKKSRTPLKLVAVPRDLVAGDRQRGDAILSGHLAIGSTTLSLSDLDFSQLGTSTAAGA